LWERDEILSVVKYEPYLRNKAALTLFWDLDARNHEITLLKIKHIRLLERYGEGNSAGHIIHRFRDNAFLEAWENSGELHELTEEVNKYSTPYPQKATGLETWFTLPDLKAIVPLPKWKMTMVSFNGAYCISLLASFILRPYLRLQPLFFDLFMTIILVIGLTYFAMPLLSSLLRRWLYPKSL
jgi:antibiotic biosynthesis monooxygenase (ABM) superfamily enzyme